jgi:hypothetical protein
MSTCEHSTLVMEYVAKGEALWYVCSACNLAFHAYRAASTRAEGVVHVIEDWAPTLGEIYPSLYVSHIMSTSQDS